MNNKTKKILLLAVLSQTMIDTIEEEMGFFKFKLKRIARSFLDELLKIMDKDFGTIEAASQLVELSQWVVDVFNININAGNMTEQQQKDFQEDWSSLLKKYNLEKK